MNKTCTIRPRWLNVNVTYVRGGLVTLEPTRNLPDIPLTSSALIKPAISSLDIHFAYSQTISGNHISDTLWEIVSDLGPEASLSKFNKLLEEKTVRHITPGDSLLTTYPPGKADYIRGVYEYKVTVSPIPAT